MIYSWSNDEVGLLKFWYSVCQLSLSEISEGIDKPYSAVKNELARLGIRRSKSEAISLQLRRLWQDSDYREHMSKERLSNPDRRVTLSATMLDKWANDPEYRRKCSEGNSRAKKAAWQDPVYARKMAIAWQNGWSGLEIDLWNVLKKYFSGEWKYAGDGSLSIEGQSPDFVNVNGKKLFIEANGCYWHTCWECGKSDVILPNGWDFVDVMLDDAKKLDIFASYGFKTLTIWEHEMKDVDVLVKRIMEFVGETDKVKDLEEDKQVARA